jgi:hypothetical protein
LAAACVIAEVEQQIAAAMGHALAQMHSSDIVHGDLTTSNMLWRDGSLVWARPLCTLAALMAGFIQRFGHDTGLGLLCL